MQSIIEAPAYPFQNLVADTGGTLGLYLGITVVAFVEVVELIIMAIVLCCRKGNPRKQSRVATWPSTPNKNGNSIRGYTYYVFMLILQMTCIHRRVWKRRQPQIIE